MHILKWLFHQGKATFQCSQKVYVYSENALDLGWAWGTSV
jgi:hypothetical protein